ncbi:MAG: hypothetical protein WCV84_00255 [Patescibacteria group bacterium]
MSLSQELKQTLTKKIVRTNVREHANKEVEESGRYGGEARQEQNRRQLTAETKAIDALQHDLTALEHQVDTLSAEAFASEYMRLNSAIKTLLQRITRWSDTPKKERFTSEFHEIDGIKDYHEFLEKLPMYWMPRKKEIGRLLSIAMHMHEQRVVRKEIAPDAPLSIVDVGGSNGALGKLLVELAKENGLTLIYTVVDPHAETVHKAQQAYAHDQNLAFHVLTGEDFAEQAQTDPLVHHLVERQRALIEAGEKKRAFLHHLCEEMELTEMEIAYEDDTRERFLHILEHDFSLSRTLFDDADPEEFARNMFEKAEDAFVQQEREKIQKITQAIEEQLAQQPATHDLIINSWMPPGIDFTKDIRMLNGAAITYIVEQWGATGIQTSAHFPSHPNRLQDEDESYQTGNNYTWSAGWVGHSVPQLYRHVYPGGGDSHVQPYSNAFLVQTSQRYRNPRTTPEHLIAHPDVSANTPYPWEDKLTQLGGDISPMISITNKPSGRYGGDYHHELKKLTNNLEEKYSNNSSSTN